MEIRKSVENPKSRKHMSIDKSKSKGMHQKPCHEHRHKQVCNETSSNVSNTSVDKTSYTSSDFGFMRLIHRGDNPNKKTLIYIPYTSYLYRLGMHNLSCPQ